MLGFINHFHRKKSGCLIAYYIYCLIFPFLQFLPFRLPVTCATTARLSPFIILFPSSSSLFILVFLNISKDSLFLYLSFFIFLNLMAFLNYSTSLFLSTAPPPLASPLESSDWRQGLYQYYSYIVFSFFYLLHNLSCKEYSRKGCSQRNELEV